MDGPDGQVARVWPVSIGGGILSIGARPAKMKRYFENRRETEGRRPKASMNRPPSPVPDHFHRYRRTIARGAYFEDGYDAACKSLWRQRWPSKPTPYSVKRETQRRIRNTEYAIRNPKSDHTATLSRTPRMMADFSVISFLFPSFCILFSSLPLLRPAAGSCWPHWDFPLLSMWPISTKVA